MPRNRLTPTLARLPKNFTPFVWLLVASVSGAFVGTNYNIPVAAWISLPFLLRFFEKVKLWKAFLLSVLLSFPIASFVLQGMIPVPDGQYFVFILITVLTTTLLYSINRLITPKIPGFLSTLAFPTLWVTYEYLNTLTSPFGSWGSLAYTQTGNLVLLQLASVTGIWGITFLIAWFGAVMQWAWKHDFAWSKIRWGVLAFGTVFLSVLTFGGARLLLLQPHSPTIRVAAITPTPQHFTALFQGEERPDLIDSLWEQTVQEAQAGAEVVFWSEGASYVKQENEEQLLARGKAVAQAENIHLGLSVIVDLGEHNPPAENKVLFITPSGEVAWEYHKAIPVPGEPFEPGDGILPLSNVHQSTVSAAICFDQDFPSLMRQAGTQQIDILFGPSNDWSEIKNTHAQMSVIRAIENGYNLVRPTGNGVSIATDYLGQTYGQVDSFHSESAPMVANVPSRGVATLYSKIGDVFAYFCMLFFGVSAAYALLSAFKRRWF